jgi:hypothetical protein
MDEGKVQRARRPGKQLAKCQNQLKYEVQGIAKMISVAVSMPDLPAIVDMRSLTLFYTPRG